MTQEKGCKKCGKKSISATSLPFIIFGFYVFAAAIYGTYMFVLQIINIFK